MKKIIAIKATVLSIFSIGNAYASCGDNALNTDQLINEKNTEINDISNRLDVINTLDLNRMTDSEKDSLIKELLNSNKSTIRIIENKEIDLREYRDEVGSHSFSV